MSRLLGRFDSDTVNVVAREYRRLEGRDSVPSLYCVELDELPESRWLEVLAPVFPQGAIAHRDTRPLGRAALSEPASGLPSSTEAGSPTSTGDRR